MEDNVNQNQEVKPGSNVSTNTGSGTGSATGSGPYNARPMRYNKGPYTPGNYYNRNQNFNYNRKYQQNTGTAGTAATGTAATPGDPNTTNRIPYTRRNYQNDGSGDSTNPSSSYQGTGSSYYKNKKRPFFSRKKFCFICSKGIEDKITYLSLDILNRYITDRGKIIPYRYSGNCTKHQRIVKKAIKRARMLSLMPFLKRT